LAVKFEFDKEFLNLKYPIFVEEKKSDIFLVDYIAQRVEKLERERRYCNRFLRDFIAYDSAGPGCLNSFPRMVSGVPPGCFR
jgi:hypothetical protein